jgi:hypothetical protein
MRIKVEGKDEVVDLPSDESEVRVAVPQCERWVSSV